MKFILTFFCLGLFFFSKGQDSTVFIGNSMLKYDKNHSLEILEKVLENQPKKHSIDAITINGGVLRDHLKSLPSHKRRFGTTYAWHTDSIEKAYTPSCIIRNHYDNILFQENPPLILDSLYFFNKTSKYFFSLDSLAKLHSKKRYWLEPYASFYKIIEEDPKINIDSVYAITYSRYLTLKEMDSNLMNVPIAYVVKEFQKKYPKEKLYIGGWHPNKCMQYILACCLYYSLFDGKPQDIPFLHLFRFDRNEVKEKGLREYTYQLFKEYGVKYKK